MRRPFQKSKRATRTATDFEAIYAKQKAFLLENGWHMVQVSGNDIVRSATDLDAELSGPAQGMLGIRRMQVWCEANTSDEYQDFCGIFFFKSKEDASLFKMFWVGI